VAASRTIESEEDGHPAALDSTNGPARLISGITWWDGAGAPGGASQGQSPARGAPDPAPRCGAA
jgi:hypothetical protein